MNSDGTLAEPEQSAAPDPGPRRWPLADADELRSQLSVTAQDARADTQVAGIQQEGPG